MAQRVEEMVEQRRLNRNDITTAGQLDSLIEQIQQPLLSFKGVGSLDSAMRKSKVQLKTFAGNFAEDDGRLSLKGRDLILGMIGRLGGPKL